jgi:putative ATP-binding cassette transporter
VLRKEKPLQSESVFGKRRFDGENPEKHESQRLMESVRAFFRIAIPFWKTRESRAAWVMLVGIVLFSALSIYLAKQFNDWYKGFWDFMQEYNLDGFIGMLWLFGFLATVHVCTVVYKRYIISAMEIRWRRWLTTEYIRRYLEDGTFYRLQLTDQKTDNPDQRISEDLSQFVALTVNITISILTDLSMLITFAIVLWDLSQAVTFPVMGYEISLPDGYLLYLAMIYAAMGTVCTFIIGRPLVLLNFRQQRYEADFRFSLVRLRENAESVAIYKGEAEERKRFNSLFQDVVHNYVNLIIKTKQIGFFTLGYAQLAVIFPILISAPMYFAKIITLGSIMQINSAFSKVQESLSTLIDNFTSLAAWKAVIDRLSLFEKSIRAADNLPRLEPAREGAALSLEHVRVTKPDGTELIQALSFSLVSGQSLLIKGHSGCGKSTLLRTVAGIWPYASGKVTFPENAKTLFLSQKPYMPLGTLKDAVCYPGSRDMVSDEAFVKMLENVGLSYLSGYLNVINQWDHVLSLGEQQRISFLRAFVNKPNLLFMDEVTSALDETNEAKLYGFVRQELPGTIVISVGHRSTLREFHTDILDMEGDQMVRSIAANPDNEG